MKHGATRGFTLIEMTIVTAVALAGLAITIAAIQVASRAVTTTVNAELTGSNGDSTSVEDVPALLYVATVQHDGDVVLLVGAHPTEIGPAEIDQSEQLLSMMGAVEH